MAGRKAKPAALKSLEGNPGRRPIKSHLMAAVEVPAPPAHMTDGAKQIFIETARLLFELGVMTGLDAHLLEAYSENYVTMTAMQKELSAGGYTYKTYTKNGEMIRQRPEVQILQACRNQHRQYAGEMGLSPASRTKLPDASQGDLFKAKASPWSEFGASRTH